MDDRGMGLTLEEVLRFTGGHPVGPAGGRFFRRVSTDSRDLEPGDLFVALKGEKFDGYDFCGEALRKGAQGVIVDRPLSEDLVRTFRPLEIRVPDTLRALGDLAAGWRRRFDIPVAALTGSNGKTTTKEMAVAILRLSFRCLWSPGNFNNRIGLPLTLLRLGPEHERVVLEMGMNEPGEIRELTRIASPQTGVLLNVGPAHLEKFGDLDGIAEAKGEMLEALPEGALFVYNRDDPRVASLARRWPGPKKSFGLGADCDVRPLEEGGGAQSREIRLSVQGLLVQARLRLPGRHNLYNALAAAALAQSLGAPAEAIEEGLSRFEGMSGRFSIEPGQRFTIVNDTYNANPRSMECALDTLDEIGPSGGRILVLGDMLELGAQSEQAHFELGRRAARFRPAALFVTGTFAHKVREGALAEGYDEEKIELFEDPSRLAREILGRIQGGEWILIKGSRGMAMERVVRALKESAAPAGSEGETRP